MFFDNRICFGALAKKRIIADGKRCLVKGNHGNSQESLNEIAHTAFGLTGK